MNEDDFSPQSKRLQWRRNITEKLKTNKKIKNKQQKKPVGLGLLGPFPIVAVFNSKSLIIQI